MDVNAKKGVLPFAVKLFVFLLFVFLDMSCFLLYMCIYVYFFMVQKPQTLTSLVRPQQQQSSCCPLSMRCP